jgi:N-acetylgalactosamine-N,N'-diacetylbacillosaminyl-diphospho-undecaprenol 4-alpha-N-acetylgalactosaminyltransferase
VTPDAPAKVLFLLPAMAGGGAERVVLQLLRRIDRTAFVPSLLLLDRSGELLPEIPSDVPVAECGRHGKNRGWAWMGVLARTMSDSRPDLIVSFLWATNLAAVTARRRAGLRRPLILCERLSLDGTEEGTFRTLLRRAGTFALHRFADRVTANSVALARQVERGAGLPPGSVVVIPNPIDLDGLRALASDPDAVPPESASWPRPWTVGVGRLHRQKGFDVLIRAFATSGAAGTLVLVGDGTERDSLRRTAEGAGVADRVVFTGFLRNPHAVLARADVFVLPSRYEGFPNALVEAMALGRPCIATRCATGPDEILDDGLTGLLVPVDDEGALGRSVVRLLRDPAFRERLGDAARERAAAYDAPAIVQKFEAFFRQTIESGG